MTNRFGFPIVFLLTGLALSAGLVYAEGTDCRLAPGALPDPGKPAGTANPQIPVEHIVVIMQENRSFDQYFGRLNDPAFYGSQIDGISPQMSNPDRRGRSVSVYHQQSLCIADTDHTWNGEHVSWDGGRVDGFVRANGKRVMSYYDSAELPYYYSLANEYAVGDRYFCSAITQTFPNRFYLLTGTSFGHVVNDEPAAGAQFNQKTIFDVLDQYGISWKYYTNGTGYLFLFGLNRRDAAKMGRIASYQADLASGHLPQVVFLDSIDNKEDEHPPENIHVGQAWVAQRVKELMSSSAWPTSALFLTYDENGGFFDHVPPPQACKPDSDPPALAPGSQPGAFDHYGFRVPFIAVSPFAKHHYVSHVTYDHTSILKFIETKFNLPALTRRDANANGLLDLFDFAHPRTQLPSLAPAPPVGPNERCVPDAS